MFIKFFDNLRKSGIPVSLREYLTFLEALSKNIGTYEIENFYILARTIMVKDERHLDRFDIAFSHTFNGLDELSLEEIINKAELPGDWLKKLAEKHLSEEEMAEIKSLGGFEKLMETLKKRLEEQKARHIPKIVTGEAQWCQGYSEPGAGSDLAGLQTKAVVDGDNFVINGQKIWTSGAQHANWMFALVRTDPEASKHNGISFVLLSMDQPGVTVKPIKLISGSSPFCETFFDNAIAKREDLIGELNKGWTVGKRLLQYERNATGSRGPAKKKSDKKVKPKLNAYAEIAKAYSGEDGSGKISDTSVRDEVLTQTIQEKALSLTTLRVVEESKSTGAPGAATSIFKYVGSTLSRDGSQLKSKLRGTAGLAWEGSEFTENELESTRGWLRDRAVTIYGGTNEVQLNIISKRVLGLPD